MHIKPISLKVTLHSSCKPCVIPCVSSYRNYLQSYISPYRTPASSWAAPLSCSLPTFFFQELCVFWVSVSSQHLGVICAYVSFRAACAPVTNALPFAVFSLIYVCRVTNQSNLGFLFFFLQVVNMRAHCSQTGSHVWLSAEMLIVKPKAWCQMCFSCFWELPGSSYLFSCSLWLSPEKQKCWLHRRYRLQR